MKLICSILILAGVLDAFAMELREKALIPQLMNMALWNKDSSECSPPYKQEMSAILDTFTKADDDCENALEAKLKELNEGAAPTLKKLSGSVATVCAISGECTESGEVVDNLDCFLKKAQEGYQTLLSVSTEATTHRTQLLGDIENAKGIKNVCKAKAWNQFFDAYNAAQDKFNDCVNGNTL
ncbi:uncharacterized protein LOC129910791 [Episyrphus balteatus]|uniref:uncharacterized protein LOC129910791 n=1 Tax=Episyrphus balteatus TaxID=286459 RepID=UPI0024852175|nr:uncharacterized protein LOC129910791 [Episyrphus balteatus]